MEKCFSAILKLCSFSFCIWFYVFAPGSHCFAIDIVNRSAICTVHLRSIWIAPLRFSTCRSWAGSRVTAAKLDPKNPSSTFPTGCSNVFFLTFFHIFHIFHIFSQFSHFSPFFTFFNICFSRFFPSASSKRIFPFFPQAHFQNAFFHIFHIVFTFLWKMWKKSEKMRFEHALGKNVKKCVLKMENVNKIWKNVKKCEQKAVEKFLFLSHIFPVFFSRYIFSCFLLNPILNYGILNLNIRIPHKAYIHFQWSMPICSQFTMNVFFKI